MTPEQTGELDARAKDVGRAIGWDLRFIVAPNPEFVGLAVGSEVIIVGPARLSEMAAHDIELTLDSLERGDHVIGSDAEGDPCLLPRTGP